LKQRCSRLGYIGFLPIDAKGSVLDIAKRDGLPRKGEPVAFRLLPARDAPLGTVEH
jgi:hypothetical protein